MKKIYMILIFLLIVSLPACKSKSEEDKNTDKISEKLKSITEGNEKIVENIEKINDFLTNPKKAEIDQDEVSKGKSENNGEENSQNEEEKDSSKEDGESEGSMGKKTSSVEEDEDEENNNNIDQIIVKTWSEITNTSVEMHGYWNEYEMESMKEGNTDEDILKFETAINGLTIAINNKDILDVMYKCNDVTMSLARFYDLYKGNIDGEKNRINYYIRGTYLYGLEDNWDLSLKEVRQAQEHIKELNNKIIIDKNNSKYLKKLEISVEDLANAVPNKSKELLKIKRDIAIENLDAILQGKKKDEEE